MAQTISTASAPEDAESRLTQNAANKRSKDPSRDTAKKEDWAGDATNASPDGEYVRDTTYIADRFSAELPQGGAPRPRVRDDAFDWPVEAGRYRLIGARACPWAHRTIITRRLLGLENAISLGLAGPTHDKRSWRFDLDPDGLDPVLGIPRLQDAYLARYPDYPRGITVPAIVEVKTAKVVTNNFPTIPIDFQTQCAEFHRSGAPDLYPPHLRHEIDRLGDWLFKEVNNGVYRCGFAGSQQAYESAYRRLWRALDWLEDDLSRRRYLVGEHITLADVYLYPTLVRFDAVYHGHFKCSRNKITEMPNLWGYLRDLWQTPGFGDTTDFLEIKQHYYQVHTDVNPTGIVPVGPDLRPIESRHHREELPGTPFAPGSTPPGPVAAGEEVRNPLSSLPG